MPVMSIEAEDAYWAAEAEAEEVPLAGPEPGPCATCPWKLRFARGEAPNPYFLHVPTTVRRLWEGHRSPAEGGGMAAGLVAMCHRGRHGDLRLGGEQFDSFTPCASAVAVQEREAVRWHEREPSLVGGEAAARVARRWLGVPPRLFAARTLTRADLVARCHPLVSDPRVGHPDAEPLRPGEFDRGPLPTHRVELSVPLSGPVAGGVGAVPGFTVEDGGGAVRVEASSARAAAAWLAALLAG